MAWDYRKWGTANDPIHQSCLNDISGQNGCAKKYFYKRTVGRNSEKLYHYIAVGNAVHETIARCLRAWILNPTPSQVEQAILEEFGKQEAEAGTSIEWGDEKPENEIAECVAMVLGALAGVAQRAEKAIIIERKFLCALDGIHFAGAIDFAYEPIGAPGEIELLDWKTGARKAPQVILDHGYQTSLYAYALEHGFFKISDRDNEDYAVCGKAPRSVSIVHLRDFVPYKVGAKKGQLRGPGWYEARRAKDDIELFKLRVKAAVRAVRMGIFIDALGEQCGRCSFKTQCLTGGEYVSKDEAKELEKSLRGIDLAGIEPATEPDEVKAA
jgi:hypothetical protein